MAKRGGASWRRRETLDPAFQQAKKLGYRSRASLKLLEINQRAQLFKRGDWVLDLGAAPGGWSQVALELAGAKQLAGPNRIIGVDLLPIKPLQGVSFLQGDFTSAGIQQKIQELLPDSGVQLVISDMAPNISGIRAKDQADSLMLADWALEASLKHLVKGGHFLVKLFQGPDVEAYGKKVKAEFGQIRWLKPKSSRSDSSEVYLLGKNRRLD